MTEAPDQPPARGAAVTGSAPGNGAVGQAQGEARPPASPPQGATEGEPSSPRPSHRLRGRRAWLAFAALVIVYLASVLPPTLSLGTNVEEIAGLLSTTPLREYVDAQVSATEPSGGGPSLRESRWMPVWSVVYGDGTELPLMVDGHIGAVPFWPYRPLLALGGITAARMMSVVLGVGILLAVLLLGARLRDERVGWLAVVLLATTPLFVFLQAWVHPDETWSYAGYLFGLLAYLRWRERGGLHLLLTAAFLFGLGVAAKNTASWNFLALAATAYLLDLMPRLSWRRWGLAAAAFLLPLVPQLAFVALSQASSLTRRTSQIAAPWDFFDRERLAFFAGHFTESFGGLGTALGTFVDGDAWNTWGPVPGAGMLFLLATVGVFLASLTRRTPLPARVLGCGLGLVVLEYVAFYYVGMSVFALVTPWVPLAVALISVAAWDAAGRRRPAVRRVGRIAIAVVCAVLLGNNISQTVRYVLATTRPAYSVFDRGAQEALARDLAEAGVAHPWTTTYGIVGVLELLTDDAVRPVHAFPVFHELWPQGYRAVWDVVLDRMGPGAHQVVLSHDPSQLDVNPCKGAEGIETELAPAVAARGGSVRAVRDYRLPTGEVGLAWVEVTLPAAAMPSPDGARVAPAAPGAPTRTAH